MSSRAQNDGTTDIPSFVGIDIDADRIRQAQANVDEAKVQGLILHNLDISFQCMNALEATELIQSATVVFLYLIPRGLKLVAPLVQRARVVLTYMSPLPDRTFSHRELVPVPHQPGAAWPLHVYEITS